MLVEVAEGVLVGISVVLVEVVDAVEGVSTGWRCCHVGEGRDQLGVAVGVHAGLVDGAGSPASSLNHHDPYRTPASCEAKKLKRPVEKSSPPYGHPIHSSMMVAWAVFPP